MTVEDLSRLVEGLSRAKVCNGLEIIAYRDRRGIASIKQILRDNLVTVETTAVVFDLNDVTLTPDRIMSRLADEFAAAWRAVYLKATAPHLHTDDGSPVMLVEEIDGERVVRI